MDLTAWLSIAVLVIVSAISLISLIRDLREKPDSRKWTIPILILTVLSLGVGIFLAVHTSRASSEAKRAADKKAQADETQIQKLQQAVTTQTQNNDTQYQRNQVELHRVEDQLTDIKTQVVAEPLRKKISDLYAELQKSLTPAPKAKLDFSFYNSPINTTPITEITVAPKDNVITFDFTVGNYGDVEAKAGHLTLRIPENCKFTKETPLFQQEPGAPDWERDLKFISLFAHENLAKMTVEMSVPPNITKAIVGVKVACDTCVEPAEWQAGTVNVVR